MAAAIDALGLTKRYGPVRAGLGCALMTTLMTYAGASATDAAVTRTGGVPLAPTGFSWPRCRKCEGHLQFLAQVLLDDLGTAAGVGAPNGRSILSIFMCQNDPGMCDEWDATSGGNQALVFAPQDLVPATPPAGDTVLGEVSAITYVQVAGDYYEQARDIRCDQQNRPIEEVLGQLGGEPSWIQDDETPDCPVCRQPMAFVAQLEQGHDHRTAANFGGGCGPVDPHMERTP